MIAPTSATLFTFDTFRFNITQLFYCSRICHKFDDMTTYQHIRREGKQRQPLNTARLHMLGLRYVARYTTNQARLRAYLNRKVNENGWEDALDPEITGLVEKFAELGYVNDDAFTATRTASLLRRGYGPNRLKLALRAAGIDDSRAKQAAELDEQSLFDSAMAYAKRRRVGPFSQQPLNDLARKKIIASFIRAGHDYAMVRKILETPITPA